MATITVAEVAYPEHERMAAVAETSQAIGEFLEWLEEQGLVICEPSAYATMPWQPARRQITDLLAAYYGLDLKKIEAEKRTMLAAYQQAGTGADDAAPAGEGEDVQ